MTAPTADRTAWVATHVVEIIGREGGPIVSYGLMLALDGSAPSAQEWRHGVPAAWSLRDGRWLHQGADPLCASFGVVRLP